MPIDHKSPPARIVEDVTNVSREIVSWANDVVVEILLPRSTRGILAQPEAATLLEVDHCFPKIGVWTLSVQDNVKVIRHETVSWNYAIMTFDGAREYAKELLNDHGIREHLYPLIHCHRKGDSDLAPVAGLWQPVELLANQRHQFSRVGVEYHGPRAG